MILEGISHFIWKLAPPGHECDIIPPTLTTLTTVWYYSTHQLEHLNIDIIPPNTSTLVLHPTFDHLNSYENIDVMVRNVYINIDVIQPNTSNNVDFNKPGGTMYVQCMLILW